jgi:hypothetical protein
MSTWLFIVSPDSSISPQLDTLKNIQSAIIFFNAQKELYFPR